MLAIVAAVAALSRSPIQAQEGDVGLAREVYLAPAESMPLTDDTLTSVTIGAWRVYFEELNLTIQTLLGSSAYTPINVTPDRSYDANATTVDELADVLGTLIADLQTKGILD